MDRETPNAPPHKVPTQTDGAAAQPDGQALRESRARLARETEDTKRLLEFSALLIDDGRTDAPYDQILDAAMAIMHSDFGSIHAFDGEGDGLRLLASRNSHSDSENRWAAVGAHVGTIFGATLRRGERVVVPDVRNASDEIDAEALRQFSVSGIAAMQSTPLTSRAGRVVGFISTHWRRAHSPRESELRLLDILGRLAVDLIERHRADGLVRVHAARMRAQKEAFQAAINGAPLEEALEALSRVVIEELDGAPRTAFYIADANGKVLHPIRAAGSMPDAYTSQVDGFPIGLGSLACGLATASGRPVVTRDVFQEAMWKPWLHLARDFDFRGCWSFPIETSDGVPIGTLAMYFRGPRDATPSDLALADAVTQAAAIILSRDAAVRERILAEEALFEAKRKEAVFEAQRLALEEVERLVAERTAERDQLHRLVTVVEEAERKRLSRELHDQLGQELTAFNLGLEEAAHLIASHAPEERREYDARIFARIVSLQRSVQRLMRRTRLVVLELRPPELDDVGLEHALDTYVREWSARYGVAAEFAVSGFESSLGVQDEVASALYRIVQEALTNVAKHARASRVSVVVDKVQNDLRLLIEDDGGGFDSEAALSNARESGRRGIIGMRERAAIVGGRLEVESGGYRGGTTVYVRMPLAPREPMAREGSRVVHPTDGHRVSDERGATGDA